MKPSRPCLFGRPFCWIRELYRRRKPTATKSRRITLQFENLEQRDVLSTISLFGGSLFLDGSNGNDAAGVRVEGDKVVATLWDGKAVTQKSFQRSQIRTVYFLGGEGNDFFVNATNIRCWATGGNGNDTLVGGAANDYLSGGAGDDVITGSEGADEIYGGTGNDFLMGGTGDDTIYAGAGNDQVYGEEGNDRIYGDAGDDALAGDAGSDRIYGGNGADRIYGGSGVDLLLGEAGADAVYGGSGLDLVLGTTWADSVQDGGPDAPTWTGLSDRELQPLVTAAQERWAAVGVDQGVFRNVQVRIADLPGNALGWTVGRSDGSAVIWVDSDAAGKGWYVDSTPNSDSEYHAVLPVAGIALNGTASSRMDLLTVLGHELGHSAGLIHTPWVGVMAPALAVGVRLVPDPLLAALAPRKIAGPFIDPMMFNNQIDPSHLDFQGNDVFQPLPFQVGKTMNGFVGNQGIVYGIDGNTVVSSGTPFGGIPHGPVAPYLGMGASTGLPLLLNTPLVAGTMNYGNPFLVMNGSSAGIANEFTRLIREGNYGFDTLYNQLPGMAKVLASIDPLMAPYGGFGVQLPPGLQGQPLSLLEQVMTGTMTLGSSAALLGPGVQTGYQMSRHNPAAEQTIWNALQGGNAFNPVQFNLGLAFGQGNVPMFSNSADARMLGGLFGSPGGAFYGPSGVLGFAG